MIKPRKTDERLEILQNTCKRVAFETKKPAHATSALNSGQKKRAASGAFFSETTA
jgi:hypothetical protein